MKKLSSRRLSMMALFLGIFVTIKAQTVINPLVYNEKPKLQFGLSQIVDLVNDNKSLNASNISNFKLFNLKENGTKIKVDILTTGNGNTVFKELNTMGIEIVARHQNFITAWLEIGKIDTYLNRMPSIITMRPSVKPQNNAGVVQSQGDAAQRSDLARALGVNGRGVKVGVLSDSYDNLGGAEAGVTAGELPGTTNPNGFTMPVTVLSDLSGGGSDEGRAMLEIIHDVAPGAQLYYYSAFNGEADFAAGIRALADAGCKVIVDDISYFAEPYFQDGIIAQAVDYAVNVKGASYFSSAANSSDQSYEAPYQASTFQPFSDGQTAHNFGTTTNPIYFLPINGSPAPVIFQWAEPYLSAGNGSPGSASDLNIYICTYNSTTNSYTVVAQSTTNNIGSDPTETFGFSNVNLANKYILITKKSGPDPTRIKVVGQRGITWTLTPTTIAGIRAGTCVGHANATGAIACGAASYDKTPAFGVNPPEIESYSSKGGTPIIFSPAGVRLPSPDDRLKPEITAPDNANTSFFVTGYDPDGDGKPNFPGTSAAAPHAAGVAALMFQGNPGITPAVVKTALINSCVDMDDPNTAGFDTGFDYRTGAGLIRADVAVQATINPNCPPTVVTITRPTTFCQGDSVIFNANTGTDFTFQWKKDGTNISGATSAQYIAKTSGNYSVIIAHIDCNVETEGIPVKMNLGVPPPTTVNKTITAGTAITTGNGLQASGNCYTLIPQTVTYSGGTIGYDGGASSGANPITVFSGLSGNVAKVKVSITWRKRSGGGTQNDCGTTGATGIPYNDEISFSLKAPDNTIITLLNYGSYARGTTSSGVVTTVFEDGNPAVGTTPASGTFASAELLSLLEGKMPNGTWTLIPYDGFEGEPLCVEGFSVTITTDGDTTPSTDITWWDAASGGTQVGSGSEYIPTNTAVGSYTYYAQVGCSNGLACNTSIRKPATLTISPALCTPPTNVTIGSNSPVTEGGAINLTSSSIGGTSQVWTGPNSYSSTEQNPTINSVTLAMTGVYTVTITSSGTCTTMATTSVVITPIPTVTVVFVNIANNAAPTQNGVSWATAYSNLQTALSTAPPNSEIWVAQGTYKPTTTTNRNIAFNIPSGAKIFGGFAGTESLKSQRNIETYSTILSGEIGLASTVSDNSYHVVTFIGVNNTTVLDGFTVMAGNANLTSERGRAVSSEPILPLGVDDGGGIGLDNGSSPFITNCKIISNDGVNGGGLFATNGSSPVITNCIFMNNQGTFGGGVYHLTGNAVYKNVLFAGNKGTGGAIYNNIANPTITNVTIAHNGGYSGAIFNSNSIPVLKNCILWGNIGPFNDTQSLVSYSIIEGGYPGMGNLNLNPQFVNPTPNSSSPFLSGNYQVNNTSPSIDGGDNVSVNPTDKDLVANPRIFNGGLVDMGAYEFQGNRVGGTITSIASGNWELGSTWNIGRKPLAGDNVIISDNHIVTVNENGVLKNLEFKPNAKVIYSISSIKLQTGF